MDYCRACVKAVTGLFTRTIILMDFVFSAHYNGVFFGSQTLLEFCFQSGLMGSIITQLDFDLTIKVPGR